MLNKILIAVIVILYLMILWLYGSLDRMEDKLHKAQQAESKALIKALDATTKLNNKAVEIVHVPSVVYEEKKVYEKPKIEYITKEVERLVMLPSYSNICFDTTGLQFANSIINRTYNNPTITRNPSK